jgi:hypothetical protein
MHLVDIMVKTFAVRPKVGKKTAQQLEIFN